MASRGAAGDLLGLDLDESFRAVAALPPTLPATLLAHAKQSPTKIFLEVWSPARGLAQSISYGALVDCMLAAALWLRDGIGLTEGEYCALLAPNSVAYLSFSLGAMSLGAVSINLNWRNPSEVNERLLANLKPSILVAGAPFRAEATAAHSKLGIRIALLEAVCNMDCTCLPFEPPPLAAAEEMHAAISRIDPKKPCAVFFTGGTTGTPKAVPHSHHGLLWFADACLQTIPEGFASNVENAGTACFTPYFHVMGFVANFVFNLHAGCRAFLLADPDEKLSPGLILSACRELRPSVLNTVPWVVEGLVEYLRSGEPSDAAQVLSSLHLVTYGGAALAPHCGPILKQNGIVVCCTYGQTELAGPIMFGKPGGDPNALRPLSGVRYELKPSADDGPGEGELLLLGNASATSGYLTLPSEKKAYRSLCDGMEATLTPQERFSTNDRFTTRSINGEAWLLYLCRADDLLVHTSGEMSNPLPTEGRLIAECSTLLHAVCVVGTNMARCMVLLDLAEGVDPQAANTLETLRAGLGKANSVQPQYSRVLDQHAILLPHGSLPLTVKGTVQRGKAEKLFADEIDACRRGEPMHPTLAKPADPDDADHGEAVLDSLNLTAAAGASSRKVADGAFEFLSGARFVLSFWVLVFHTTWKFGMWHDTAIHHAYIGVSFFIVLAGFSTHYAYTGHDLAPRGQVQRTLLHYTLRRVDRIVLSTWVSMAAAQIIEGSFHFGWTTWHILRCYTFIEFLTGDLNEYVGATPLFGSCPNGPTWTISCLLFCWLTYPLYQPLLDRLVTPNGHVGRLLGFTLLFNIASLLPQYIVLWSTAYPTGAMNAIHTWPPTYIADFLCGCAAAGCVKAHAKSFSRPEADVVDGSAALLEEGVRNGGGPMAEDAKAVRGGGGGGGGGVRHLRMRGHLADLLALALLIFVFNFSALGNEGLIARLYGIPSDYKRTKDDTSVGLGCHLWSAYAAAWVYCVCASNEGAGLLPKLLRHPALTSLGNYAFHMYLFTLPNKFFWQWVFDQRIWGEGYAPMWEPTVNLTELYTDSFYDTRHKDKLQASQAWTLEFVSLMLVSGFYAHLVEEPLVQRFRRWSDRLSRAPRKKL